MPPGLTPRLSQVQPMEGYPTQKATTTRLASAAVTQQTPTKRRRTAEEGARSLVRGAYFIHPVVAQADRKKLENLLRAIGSTVAKRLDKSVVAIIVPQVKEQDSLNVAGLILHPEPPRNYPPVYTCGDFMRQCERSRGGDSATGSASHHAMGVQGSVLGGGSIARVSVVGGAQPRPSVIASAPPSGRGYSTYAAPAQLQSTRKTYTRAELAKFEMMDKDLVARLESTGKPFICVLDASHVTAPDIMIPTKGKVNSMLERFMQPKGQREEKGERAKEEKGERKRPE